MLNHIFVDLLIFAKIKIKYFWWYFHMGSSRNVVECQKKCRKSSECDHFRFSYEGTWQDKCVLLKTDVNDFKRKQYCSSVNAGRDVYTFIAYGGYQYVDDICNTCLHRPHLSNFQFLHD